MLQSTEKCVLLQYNLPLMEAKCITLVSTCRYQDVHNQSYIMINASGRWLGVRLDIVAALLIGAVALAAVLVAQDAGNKFFLHITHD